MKKNFLLAPILLLSACVTINNMGGKPVAANQPPNGIAMKPPTESVDFIDSTDGNVYKWVKVRVFPSHPYDDFTASPYKVKTTTPIIPAVRVTPKTGSFKDERDGQIYKTVTLGKQT